MPLRPCPMPRAAAAANASGPRCAKSSVSHHLPRSGSPCSQDKGTGTRGGSHTCPEDGTGGGPRGQPPRGLLGKDAPRSRDQQHGCPGLQRGQQVCVTCAQQRLGHFFVTRAGGCLSADAVTPGAPGGGQGVGVVRENWTAGKPAVGLALSPWESWPRVAPPFWTDVTACDTGRHSWALGHRDHRQPWHGEHRAAGQTLPFSSPAGSCQ